MLDIQRPTVESLSPKRKSQQGFENRQEFEISPLEPGFGHTIGNSLRRTLLSSIPGAAVTQVRFEGAIHEFGTIEGVTTDITDIILNLKDLVLTVLCAEPVTLRLDIRGPADVIAADILPHPDVVLLEPDSPIATIEGHHRLALDITVARGLGYVSAEDNKTPETAIGVIPVDSIFTPVRRVAFRVEPTRVGQSTDYDRLVLDIETDGSITPSEALASAGATLRNLLKLVENMSEEPQGLELSEINPDTDSDSAEEILIDDLDLNERPRNCLKRAHITTLNDLLQRTRDDLLAITNFGDKSLEEVVHMLDEQGLALRGEEAGI